MGFFLQVIYRMVLKLACLGRLAMVLQQHGFTVFLVNLVLANGIMCKIKLSYRYK